MENESQEVEIETPEGTVRVEQLQVEPIPQKITLVEGNDLEQLTSFPADNAFVKKYKPEVVEPTLVDYDDAFHAWQNDESGEYFDDDVIKIVGGYLGNRCIADFDVQWVRVEDQFGTDYAIRAKKSEVMIFPFSSVRKRIVKHEHGFVHGVYHTLKHLLESDNNMPRDDD